MTVIPKIKARITLIEKHRKRKKLSPNNGIGFATIKPAAFL
jgi:hypothetical protein